MSPTPTILFVTTGWLLLAESGEPPSPACARARRAAAHTRESTANHEATSEPLARSERSFQVARRDPYAAAAGLDRALALEELGLRRRAVEAWRSYLSLNPSSQHAERVRDRIAELVRSSPLGQWEIARRRLEQLALAGDEAALQDVVRRFPQAVREHAEERLFAAWADSMKRGERTVAERTLRVAERLGAALQAETGDAMVRDTAATIRAAVTALDARYLEHLVRGHQLYSEGKRLYDAYDLTGAGEPLANAARELTQAASPFSAWPSFYLAVGAYWRGDFDTALQRLEQLGAEPVRKHPILLAHLDWMIGLVRARQGQLGASLAHYRAAHELFERTRQEQNIVQVQALIASDLALLGAPEEAWAHLRRAVHANERVYKLRWRVTLLETAAETAAAQGRPVTALELTDEAVRLARLAERTAPGVLVEALARRARAHHEVAGAEAARRDLDEARATLPAVHDPDTHRLMEAQLLAAEAKVLRTEDPERVIASLSRALDQRSRSGSTVHLPGLLVERGHTLLARGDAAGAEADFVAALTAFEQGRLEPSLFPRLARLPHARAEADEIGALYADRELLTGESATEKRFLAAASGASIIHFAGHAVANQEYPFLSHLILAADVARGDDGALMSAEIRSRELPRTRLVVLAACRTGAARISPNEGVLSLARPFLAAGVPAVVATLWEMDDHIGRELFLRFHRRLRKGMPTEQALRETQLALLQAPEAQLRSPAAWAACELIR